MTVHIKVYKSTQAGAPVLSGQVGAGIALLDACLVTGYNSKTVTLTRSGATVTATASSHGFAVGDPIAISGANESEYNGEWACTSVATDTFTFAISGTPATPATGTITAKIAPAGFTKPYTGTNKAVFQMAATVNGVTTTGACLRVDDTNAQHMAIRAYEAMTDVDTGTGQFPTAALSTNFSWPKSSTANATARVWILISDGAFFYFTAVHHASYTYATCCTFGDFISYKAGDLYNALITGSAHATPATMTPGTYEQSLLVANANTAGGGGIFFPRSYTQIGTAVAGTCIAYMPISTLGFPLGYTSTASILAYPNGPDNALHLRGHVELAEISLGYLRGYYPGSFVPIQRAPLSHGDTVTNIAGLAGKTVMILAISSATAGTTYEGRLVIDITGPWRG